MKMYMYLIILTEIIYNIKKCCNFENKCNELSFPSNIM